MDQVVLQFAPFIATELGMDQIIAFNVKFYTFLIQEGAM
jgi:hypothetical protein